MFLLNGQSIDYSIGSADHCGFTKIFKWALAMDGVKRPVSCHSVPTVLVHNGGKYFTGGNTYEMRLHENP